MITDDWKLRARVFVQRFWQPTSACITCMPGSLANVMSLAHWELALRTGLATGLLALLISFTPLRRAFRHRIGNALLVGALTAIGDSYSHANHYGFPFAEPLVTGAVAALLALVASYLFEDRARRLRAVWTRLVGA